MHRSVVFPLVVCFIAELSSILRYANASNEALESTNSLPTPPILQQQQQQLSSSSSSSSSSSRRLILPRLWRHLFCRKEYESTSCTPARRRFMKLQRSCCDGLECAISSRAVEQCRQERSGMRDYYYTWQQSSNGDMVLQGPEPNSANRVMAFLAFGDTPYDDDAPNFEGRDYDCVQNTMIPGMLAQREMADFVLHIGDIKRGYRFEYNCTDSFYSGRKALFVALEAGNQGGGMIDFLMLPGDNEWNDCAEYIPGDYVNDPIKLRWRRNFVTAPFASFDRTFPFGGTVTLQRQPDYPENYFFHYSQLNIAFLGITLAEGDTTYNQINAEWVSTKLQQLVPRPRAIVLAGHASLPRAVMRALDPFKDIPTLYVKGNDHVYNFRFPDTTNYPMLLELTVQAYELAPLLVTLVENDRNEIFFHVEILSRLQCSGTDAAKVALETELDH